MELTFLNHLAILKPKFCHPRLTYASDAYGTLVGNLLDPTLFDQQASFFTITMKNNSHGALHMPPNYNHTTKLWGCLASNAIVAANFLEYLKLVELAIVMVLGSVENEKTFSIINFMKFNLCNHLTFHLDLVIILHAQKIYKLETFPLYTIT